MGTPLSKIWPRVGPCARRAITSSSVFFPLPVKKIFWELMNEVEPSFFLWLEHFFDNLADSPFPRWKRETNSSSALGGKGLRSIYLINWVLIRLENEPLTFWSENGHQFTSVNFKGDVCISRMCELEITTGCSLKVTNFDSNIKARGNAMALISNVFASKKEGKGVDGIPWK